MPEEVTLKVQRLLAPHPPQAPAGWLVLNAPRPLMGSLQAGGRPCHWTGDFAHGVFYAAVDLDNADGYAWEWLTRNADDDAWLCEFITPADIDAWAEGFAQAHGLNLTHASPSAIRQSYFVHNGYAEVHLARTADGKAAVLADPAAAGG